MHLSGWNRRSHLFDHSCSLFRYFCRVCFSSILILFLKIPLCHLQKWISLKSCYQGERLCTRLITRLARTLHALGETAKDVGPSWELSFNWYSLSSIRQEWICYPSNNISRRTIYLSSSAYSLGLLPVTYQGTHCHIGWMPLPVVGYISIDSRLDVTLL